MSGEAVRASIPMARLAIRFATCRPQSFDGLPNTGRSMGGALQSISCNSNQKLTAPQLGGRERASQSLGEGRPPPSSQIGRPVGDWRLRVERRHNTCRSPVRVSLCYHPSEQPFPRIHGHPVDQEFGSRRWGRPTRHPSRPPLLVAKWLLAGAAVASCGAPLPSREPCPGNPRPSLPRVQPGRGGRADVTCGVRASAETPSAALRYCSRKRIPVSGESS